MAIITESQWLAYYGFQHFPFERPEAGNEGPEFLSSCFVEPENFPAILGKADSPTTALLFAARGTGKTACRVMVDYFCRTGNAPVGSRQETAYVLSIPHTHLHLVAAKANLFATGQEAQVDKMVDYHVREILQRAIPAFSDLLATNQELYDAVAKLSPALKQDLSWLILSYDTILSSSQRVFLHHLLGEPLLPSKRLKLFTRLGEGLRDLLGKPVTPSMSQQRQRKESERPFSWQDPTSKTNLDISPLDHLAQLTDLIHEIGVPATYVLIDGVDEYMETAADPEKAFQMIRPLLGTLQLMDKTPHLALKFFLPDSIEPLIKRDPAIRLDRGFIFQAIHWRDPDLIKILRGRLDVVKREEYRDQDRTITGFDALCVPELRGQIEQDLAREAGGNPRHLIVLAGLMVRAHFDRKIAGQEDPYQLNQQDWQLALETYKSRITLPDHTGFEKENLDILSLIGQGENERIEFKASLRWDFQQQKVNRHLEYVIAKTIAAFLNTNGGILLIGVSDEGEVVGLDHDLPHVKHKNIDGFRQKLTQTIETYLGIEAIYYMSISIETIETKQIAVIKVKQSHQPIYISYNNQSEFWIRVDNTTRQLDPEETYNHIKIHWGEKVK